MEQEKSGGIEVKLQEALSAAKVSPSSLAT